MGYVEKKLYTYNSSGDIIDSSEPETVNSFDAEGTVHTNPKEYFTSGIGKGILKELVFNTDIEEIRDLPTLFEHTLIAEYYSQSYGYSLSMLEDQNSYDDDSSNESLEALTKFVNEEANGIATIIFIAEGELRIRSEPIFEQYIRYLDTTHRKNTPMIPVVSLASRNEEIYSQIEFDDILGQCISICYLNNATSYIEAFVDTPFYKKRANNEFIRNDDEEKANGQKFMNYENKNKNKETLFQEGQIKVLQKKGKNEYDIVDVINRDSSSSMFGEKEVNYKGVDYSVRKHPKYKDCIIL